MVYTVTITRQGQISIPAPLRKSFGLNRSKKALVYEQNGKILIDPVVDFLSLRGSVKTNKKISSKEIRAEFEKYLAKRHLK